MALDDRDYYREELARKRGVRPPLPFGQPIAPPAKQSTRAVSAATPLLDAMIGERPQPKRWLWPSAFAALASVIVAEAAWLLLHSWN
jgi:hypothetical protein